MRYWREVSRKADEHRLAADVALLVIVWALARLDGGTVAARAAEMITIALAANCLWRCARHVLPRSRADEAYVRVLLRSSSWRDRAAPTAGEPTGRSSVAVTRLLTLLVFVTTLCVLGELPSAPPTGTLPLMPAAGVIASASGGSSIDAATYPRFRYMAIIGQAGVTGQRFLAAEADFLRHLGWNHQQSDVFTGYSAQFKSVPVTAPGVNVELDSPDGGVYCAMSAVTNEVDALQETAGSPLSGNTAVNKALANHRPMLLVMLGNGRHA